MGSASVERTRGIRKKTTKKGKTNHLWTRGSFRLGARATVAMRLGTMHNSTLHKGGGGKSGFAEESEDRDAGRRGRTLSERLA